MTSYECRSYHDMGACYQPTDLKYIKEGRRYIKISHTVHFTQYKVHHWNEIENPILVIWLMSGMIVFDLDMVGIDGLMGQKWQDATVRSHAVLVAQNRVHH